MASVEAVLKLRSGETQVFSEPAGDGSGPLDLVSTRKALLNIQKTVNDVLTELVNEEKKPGPSGDAADKSSKTATDDNLTSGKEPSSGSPPPPTHTHILHTDMYMVHRDEMDETIYE